MRKNLRFALYYIGFIILLYVIQKFMYAHEGLYPSKWFKISMINFYTLYAILGIFCIIHLILFIIGFIKKRRNKNERKN